MFYDSNDIISIIIIYNFKKINIVQVKNKQQRKKETEIKKK